MMIRTAALVLAAFAPLPAQFKGQLPLIPGAADAVPQKKVFVFEMQKDGTVRHGAKVVSADQLKEAMAAFARKHPDAKRKVGGRAVCAGNVHARLHPDVPYEALHRVLLMCSNLWIYRLHLGVRSEKDGQEKALRVFLPVEDPWRQKTVTPVHIRYGLPKVGDAKVRKQMRSSPRREKDSGLRLHVQAQTPIAVVARVVDLAQREGFEEFSFAGGAFAFPAWSRGSRDFRKLVAKMPKRGKGLPGVKIGATVPDMIIEETEEVEEEEEEEEVEEEEDPPQDKPKKAQKKGTFNTAVGNRRRPPRKGEVASKVAIGLALDWLAKHQDEDGRWDADGFMKHDKGNKPTDGKGKATNDVGVTGLALLAFLGDGNTLRVGPYKDVVKKGVKWLRNQQQGNGLFGTNATHDFIYNHAIATYAMCEAYGLSQYKLLLKNAQKGINYLESHRNPYAVWRYQPRDNDNDVSVTSWCLMAYKAAKDFKLQVNERAFRLGEDFLHATTDPATGRCGYSRRGEPSSRSVGGHATKFPVSKGEAMTGAALFLRYMLGQDPKKRPVMRHAAGLISSKPPAWKDDGRIDFYYWYYGTYALYQHGGEPWTKWNKALTGALLPNQRKDGNFAGSWDPVSVWSFAGGRVYSTAMCALSLEAVYRYSRLVK